MKHLVRETLATDDVFGFYSATKAGQRKYPRIQIKLKSGPLIEQLAIFLSTELGLEPRCRTALTFHEGYGHCPTVQQILQISRMSDIRTWIREIGSSNPVHISRMMIYELLGEVDPNTSIKKRLLLLLGHSLRTGDSELLHPSDLVRIMDNMENRFGFPRLGGHEILGALRKVNGNLESRAGRRLPAIVDLRAAGGI